MLQTLEAEPQGMERCTPWEDQNQAISSTKGNSLTRTRESVISGRDGTTQDMNRTLQDKTQTSLADRDAMGMNLVV